jgi:hypothetical protein
MKIFFLKGFHSGLSTGYVNRTQQEKFTLYQATRTFAPVTVETQSLQVTGVIAATFGKRNDMIDL